MLEVISNGSKWYGEEPDSIDTLIQVLYTYTLDPRFERYGNFVNPNPQWLPHCQEKYQGCTKIFGNFRDISHVFDIITDEQDVIQKLSEAIKHNKASKEYQAIRGGR